MRALDAITRPWRVLCVGGGPMESELRSWATRHADRVRVVTGVPHDKVPAYLNAMDLLAAPSQTTPRWREQFGRMLVEAFACGVPVVGSDSGEIPHVIADAGRILPEQDEAAWSRGLAELLDNFARRTELAERGRERAQQFAWPVIARKHLEFFESVLSANPRPSAE
jgi:glycosyltransferase involved in cell wall biosynthesis